MMKLEESVNPFSIEVIQIAQEFDDAFEDKDISQIRNLIEKGIAMIPSENTPSQAQLCYSLGTAFDDIARLTEVDDELVEKQQYFFRKSIALVESRELGNQNQYAYIRLLKLQLYTNFGNTLNRCGRKIAAIEQYRKALLIQEDFGMALGNLGGAYSHYGNLVYDPSHRDYLNHFAFYMLNQSITGNDPSVSKLAKECFSKMLDKYDNEYLIHLSKPLQIPQYHYSNQEEKKYKHWGLKNGLFLNPLNDLPVIEFCFAADVVQLPPMITITKYDLRYHRMFNQFKQEYIFARYQYFCSKEESEQVHFADKETYLLDCSNYSQYSIRIETLKSAFRTLFAILDKVAFFINFYFDLGIPGRDVSFRSIWLSEKQGKNGYKYKNILDPDENFSLASIYWISKDFFDKFHDSPNPQAQRVRDIRNALEHRFLEVKWNVASDDAGSSASDMLFFVPEEELSMETLKLLKLIREVIICLSLAVGIEENKRKREFTPSEVVLPITIPKYIDEWKL